MPRVRRNRDVQLVHFSFFDLLFGAFGAFVFLMIMHVIRTIGMVDVDLQTTFDEVVFERNAMAAEVLKYKEKEGEYADLKGKYETLMKEWQETADEVKKNAAQRAKDQAKIQSMEDEVNSLKGFRDKYEERGEAEKQLVEENERLKARVAKANQQLAALELAPLKVKTRAFPPTLTGENVLLALAAEGGLPPYTWDVTGQLPDGLSLNRENGVILGRTRKEGSHSFVAKVTDTAGNTATSSGKISLSVVKRPVEQEVGVSPGFVLVSIIASLLLIYVFIKKIQVHIRCKRMRDQGYEPVWVKKR